MSYNIETGKVLNRLPWRIFPQVSLQHRSNILNNFQDIHLAICACIGANLFFRVGTRICKWWLVWLNFHFLALLKETEYLDPTPKISTAKSETDLWNETVHLIFLVLIKATLEEFSNYAFITSLFLNLWASCLLEPSLFCSLLYNHLS